MQTQYIYVCYTGNTAAPPSQRSVPKAAIAILGVGVTFDILFLFI